MLTRSFPIGISRDFPNFVSRTLSVAFLKSASACVRRLASPSRSPVPRARGSKYASCPATSGIFSGNANQALPANGGYLRSNRCREQSAAVVQASLSAVFDASYNLDWLHNGKAVERCYLLNHIFVASSPFCRQNASQCRFVSAFSSRSPVFRRKAFRILADPMYKLPRARLYCMNSSIAASVSLKAS